MEKLPAWSQSTLDRDVPLQSLLYDIFQKHILKARFFTFLSIVCLGKIGRDLFKSQRTDTNPNQTFRG